MPSGGGGGGGGATKFQAQGQPPSFDYQTATGLNQMAIGGDIESYALSDVDFANRYPALQQAYNNYQANLASQTGLVGMGQFGQAQLMQGLGGMALGRMGTPTTTDIQGIQNAAATAAQATQPIYNLGASQAGLAQPIVGAGQGIQGLGQQIAGMAATPYQLGQQLLQEPIDPQTQQQLMRAGLGTTAGALGAASLGQGMAGQAAAARQLGLGTLQYGQAMRGEAAQNLGLAASIAGQGGQLQGLGAQTMGLGGQQLGAAGQLYGLGGQSAATAGGLSGAAQQAQEQYGMDTAQMASMYGGLQNQQAMNLMTNMQTAGQLFQKRPFGLGGTNLAQADLGQAGAYNSFQQANYATMNGIAFNQAQMAAQQQQLQAQQSAGMMSAGVGAATTAASTGAQIAALTCWIARECLGEKDPRWQQFRLWLLNSAPPLLRRIYLRHGEAFATFLSTRPAPKLLVRMLLLGILQIQRKRIGLLWGLSQVGSALSAGYCFAPAGWPTGNFLGRKVHRYRSVRSYVSGLAVHPCPA